MDAQGRLIVADCNSQRIRMILPSGEVKTIAGDGAAGYLDGPGSGAHLRLPLGVAVDAQGKIYVTDSGNLCVRVLTPAP